MRNTWQFDFRQWSVDDLVDFQNGRPKPLARVFELIGRTVVDGPVRIDWSDRFGWTALTIDEYIVLVDAFHAAVHAFFCPLATPKRGLFKR